MNNCPVCEQGIAPGNSACNNPLCDLNRDMPDHTPELYTFLAPRDLMADGDETISPWFVWGPIPRHSIGGNVSAKGAPRVRRPYAMTREQMAAPDLLKACEALHDALNEILEDCASADREGEIEHVHGNEYEIGRTHRAQALRAIRKSFRALAKAKGES